MRSHLGALAMLLAVGLLAGCSSTAGDKSGAPSVVTFVVGFNEPSANSNGQSPAGAVFMSELKKSFGDRLDLVEKPNLGEGKPGGDAATIRMIANGEIDGGWVPVRALSDAGIQGFGALTAPMLITTYEAEAAVVEGEVAQAFLDRFQGSGIVGLSLAVGGLRRPVGVQGPLLAPEDWAGQEVAVVTESQKAAFADVGATAKVVETSIQNQLTNGATASEMDMGTYHNNLLAQQAPYVTSNVVLWPKMWALVFNEDRFSRLSPEQQAWVRAAATTATAASVAQSHDESSLVAAECASGARFAAATPQQVRELRAAFASSMQRLMADPVDGPLLAKLQSVVAQHSGVDALTVPDGCVGRAPRPTRVGAISEEKSELPPGTYRVTLTEQDLLDAGVPNPRAKDNDVIVTLTVKSDGTYSQTADDIDPVSPAYTNLLWEVGTIRGQGSTVFFLPDVDQQRQLKAQGVNAAVDGEGNNLQTTPYSALWSMEKGRLTFKDVQGIYDPIGVLWLALHPYSKIS